QLTPGHPSTAGRAQRSRQAAKGLCGLFRVKHREVAYRVYRDRGPHDIAAGGVELSCKRKETGDGPVGLSGVAMLADACPAVVADTARSRETGGEPADVVGRNAADLGRPFRREFVAGATKMRKSRAAGYRAAIGQVQRPVKP